MASPGTKIVLAKIIARKLLYPYSIDGERLPRKRPNMVSLGKKLKQEGWELVGVYADKTPGFSRFIFQRYRR